MKASENGDTDVVRKLIKDGVDLNLQDVVSCDSCCHDTTKSYHADICHAVTICHDIKGRILNFRSFEVYKRFRNKKKKQAIEFSSKNISLSMHINMAWLP